MEPRILVLLALACAAVAGPITIQETTNCATECSPSGKYSYAPGTTYMYDYRVDTETSMSGASEDSAKLTLTARAEIEVLSHCEMALTLRDTRLFHSDAAGGLKAADREEYFRRGLETASLRFSFQNGVIEHTCSGSRDEAWALNIKKGVLSAFQNSMEDVNKAQNVTETDVAGTCNTEYQVISSGYYSNSVRKTKDVLTCADRHDYRTMMQMVPYKVPTELHNMPLMKTTYQCEQEIQKGGVLQSSTCTESHVYRPFANGQSGGATTVKQTLTYKTYSSGVSAKQDTISSRDSLVFDHSASRPSAEQARSQTEQAVQEICESSDYDIRPESPRLFSKLVTALKGLDKQAMEEILTNLKIKSMCPTNNKAYKLFLDALPMTSTSASVSLMTSLINNKDVEGLQAKAWIASLAFIKAPTSEMLLDAKQLIDNERLSEDAMLPVSSMVNNFCGQQSACDQSYAVMSIVASLQKQLGRNCDASGKDFHQILLALRAIGNAGHTTRAVPDINKCLTATSNPLEIRVAAAGAFRRIPCDAENDDLWKTFENPELDSELRIAAYLALIRCPSDATLSKMAASLDGELDEQVGAFVYSHLINLRETSDPHKQDVVRAMQNLVIPTKFESNPMKASVNLEASALLNKINSGFVAESNLVWSNSAQLPRSASANLTVELFGQSINLVDFGGRLEGLEYLIKNLFGPYMGAEGKKAKAISDDDVHGSIYGRIFGNEMVFMHSKQMSSPLEKVSNKWLDMLITLSKKQEFAFTHSAQFMDASMIVPTAAGLPIHIAVNGSAVVDMVLSGKADLRKVSSSPRSMDVDGEIRPSAAMEVTGTMSVDAFVTKTGLRMRNTLHTSTSLKGRIQMERGRELSVEFDTPKDKMEIFDARSTFFIVHNNVEQEQKMITENRKEFEMCTCDKTADIFGMKLCGQVSFPNASLVAEGPYFPLTGPSSASLTLVKTDTHSGYKLLAKRVVNKKMSVAQISFNTPGSRVNRVILIDMTMDYPGMSVDAQVVTPWKKAAFVGNMMNSKNLKGMSGSLTVDDSDIYALTSEVKISKSKGKYQLNPKVEIRKPGMDNIQLSGFVGVETPFKALDMDMSLTGLQKLPYNVKAAVSNTKRGRSLKASVSKDGDKTQYSMEVSHRLSIAGKKATIASTSNSFKVNTPKKEIISMKMTADYKEDKSLKMAGSIDIDRVMKRPASMKLDILKNAKKRGARYDIDAAIKSSPISGRIDSNMYIKTSGLVSTKTAIDFTIPKVAKNKIILSGKFNDRSTKAYTKYLMKSTVDVKKNPEYNMGINFEFDHKKKHTEAELEVKYGANFKDKTKRVFLSTSLNRKIPNYKNAVLSYKMKAEAPAHNVNLFLNGKHTHTPKMVDSDVKLTYGEGKDISASVLLKDKSTKLANMNGRASIAWPGSEYVLSSKVDQKKAKVAHGISLKGSNGMAHSIDTVYKTAGKNNHAFTTVFNLKGLKRTTVSGSANLASKKMLVEGEVKYGKDAYGISTSAKKSKLPGGVVTVEAFCPDRRVVMKIDGEKAKNKYEGNVEASWDADKDKSKKITLGGSVYNKNARSSVSLGGDLSFTSPFKDFEKLATNFKYGSDNSQHDITGKFNWGGKNKQVMSSLTLKRPISLSNFVGTIEAKTPFKSMRSASADISHTWNQALNTIIKGNLNKESAKLMLNGEGSLDNLRGSMALSSSIKNAEDISGSLSHKHGNGKVDSSIILSHNGKPYGYDLNMDHSRNGWKVNNKGDLVLTTPKSKISTTWMHKNGDNDVKSTVSSQWGKKKFNVHLTGSHDLSSMRNINGELKVQSPWKSMGDVVISLNHKQGQGSVNSKAMVIKDGKTKASSDVKFSANNDKTGLDFVITSPFHEDLSGKIDTKYDSYPITSAIEFQWEPRKKVSAEASLNAENWDTAAFDLKLKTPFAAYRKLNLLASNKKDGVERISHVNLDYGRRENIDIEARHALKGQNKMVRVKLSTPFESVKSLDTGLQFNGKATKFDSTADFEMVPLVGKFQGSANWHYDGDMSGSLRLDTPHPDYPYFELTATSNDKGRARKSRVEAKIHPRQVYSLDTVYALELPISFEATVNSPYPEYDNLGLVFQHNHSPSSVVSHGEVRYQADKKIEGDLNADWSSNVEGSLMVRTPFSGYESSKLAIRHQGDSDDFVSHGEINVVDKSVVADASFKSGYTTTGMFTLSSPIPGMENIKMDIKKKGKARNFKGDFTLTVNGEKIDADYNHRLTKDGLKAAFKLATPYTQNLRMSVEHNGKPERFTNEISANYGRKYDLDTVASFDYGNPDVTGHGTIKYKLGGRRNTARLNFNKNGHIDDMSFSSTAGFNDDDINVSGSWKNRGGMEGNVKINTPFEGFKTTGMSMSHVGSVTDFKSSADVTYMDNKNINGKVAFATNGLRLVRLDSEIATPFQQFPSAIMSLNHNYDQRRNMLNGEVSLTTPVAEFGSGSLSYEKTGSLDNLNVVSTAKKNGKQVANFKLAHTMTGPDVHSNMDVDVSEYPALTVNFDHMGDLSSFNTKASANLGDERVFGEITKRGPIDDLSLSGTAGYNSDAVEVSSTWNSQRGIDSNIDVKTPFENFNDVGMRLSHTGDISDFSTSASIEYMDDKTISGKVDFNTNDNIRLATELSTPFQGFEYTKVEANGAFDEDVNTKASLTTTINSFGTGEASFSKTGRLNNLVVDGSILRNNVELGNIKITNDMNGNAIRCAFNCKYADMPEVMLTLDHDGDFSDFNTKVHASADSQHRNGKQAANMKIAHRMTGSEMHSNMDVDVSEYPALTMSFDHEGDLSSFNTKASANLGGDRVFGEVTKRGPIDDLSVSGTAGYNSDAIEVGGTWNSQRGVDGNLVIKTPFENFNNVGMKLSHTGDISDFSTSASVEYNDDKTISGKVDFSNNDNIRFATELSTPFQGFEYTRVETNSALNEDMTTKASLSTTINSFGTGEASFSKTGRLNNLVVDGSILRNNVELGTIKITNDMNGNAIQCAFNCKYADMPEVKLTLDHDGDFSNFNTKVHASAGNKNVIEGEANLAQRGDSLNADTTFSYDIQNIGSNKGSLTVSKDGKIDDINVKVTGKYDDQESTIIGEMKLKDEVTGSLTINTPVDGFRNVGVSFSKDGEVDDFNVKVTGKYNDQESTIMGEMKLKDKMTGSLTINTPIDGFRNVGASFKHTSSAKKFNSEGKFNLADGEDYSGKVSVYRNKLRLIEANVEIQTPIQDAEFTKFEYRHDGQKDSFKCSATLDYGRSKKITYDMSAAVAPNLDFSVTIKTPFDKYENLMASATVDADWPKISIDSKINGGNGNVITVLGSLDASKATTGSLTLTTPVEGFTNVGLSFGLSGKLKNFKSEGRVTYMDGKEISGNVVFKFRRSYLSAEVKTPFSGYEYTKYEWNQSSTKAKSTTTTYLVYGNGKVVSTEAEITFKPQPGFSITIKTPTPNYEELMASATVDNSWPKLSLNSKASAGIDRQITFDAAFDASNDISGSVEIKTPIDGFNNVGVNFQHSGDAQKFDSEGKVTYMDGQDISGKVSFYKYMWRRLVATAELSTPFTNAENTKAEINFEDNSNSISTTAALEYGNGKKMDGNMKLTYSPSYEALVTINTPFYNYRVIRALGSLDVTAPSYSAGYSVNYGYNTVYSANGKLNLYSADNVDGSLEVVLPIRGIEFTKAEYQHKIDSSRVDGSVSLTYGDSQTISGELKATNVPNYDATVTIKSPFLGYENMQGSATYGDSFNKYEATSSLDFGRGQSFSLNTGLDMSVEPYRASAQMSTPYSDYRNMEIVLTHEGTLSNFHCTGFFASPLTDNINAEAGLKYNSHSDMEASVSLKSSVVGMDDLLAEIKNSDVSGEKKTHAVVGWTSGQQIVFDGMFRQQESWYENKIYSEMSLSTPFIAARSLSAQMEHNGKQEESAQKLSFELNGDKLLDMDTEYSSKDKHQASVTFRNPVPMKYTVATGSNAGLTEAEVTANWNRNEMDSNVRLLATVNDKSDGDKTDRSVDIGFEHASRKVGLVHDLTSSSRLTASSGKIYWDSDDSSKISYDMQLKDSSRRRNEMKDGHFTIGLPSRTLKLAGSCSDNKATKSADVVFSWDADREDKQVGIKGTIVRGDRVKGDITLSMPAIRKEIRVDGEVMAHNGRVILDAKTDISYSQDSRKTLTLTSKLEDISDYYSRYNYSLAVGVSHPYTNVDIQMKSHLGSSDEKMTVGVSTDYLTARRQNKNLGLLAEINKLKRQISMQLTNPMQKVEIVGDVVSTSPYKVRMINRVDDVETFRTGFTLDEDKKSVELEMFEGAEGVRLWAGYPNSTAFRGEVRRINNGNEMTESLLAVRLNTSRLMHTRVHWKPEMIQEIRQAIKSRAIAGGVMAAETLAEFNTAFSEELAGKYADITSSIKEELSPLVDDLEKEMTQVARSLTKMSRELRVAYQNNAFYVQEMGKPIADAYVLAQRKLISLTREYKKSSAEITQSLNQGLEKMASYPVKEKYDEMVKEGASWLDEKAQAALTSLESCLAKADAALTEYHNTIIDIKQRATDSVYNATYLNYISNQLTDVDVSSYMPSYELPQEYTNVIYNVHDAINTRLGDVLNAPGLRYVKGGVDEVYQQGVWAYNYWQLEENIYAHAQNIIKLVREIVHEELKEYAQELQGLYQNPITVWDPEHGELQAEFKLPMDVARLDEVPDISPLTDKVVAYLPDATTLEKIEQSVSDFWESTADENEVEKQLKKYKPSRKFRKAKKGRKYRARNPRN